MAIADGLHLRSVVHLKHSGYKVALDSIFAFRTDTAVAVYNLEASGNHNYYVSESGVLVHNSCAEEFLHFGKNKIAKSLFHGSGGVKERILEAVGFKKFGWKVGDNPDIMIKNGKIILQGSKNGPFKGKSYPTNLNSKDYFGF